MAYFNANGTSRAKVQPGTEVIGFLGEQVMSLSLAMPSSTVTAQRSRPGAPFSVMVTFADDRPSQHCTSTGDLRGHLAALTSIVAGRQWTAAQLKDEFQQALGTLSITTGAAEGDARLDVFADRQRQRTAAAYGGIAIEIRHAAASLDALAAGCARLGQH